MEVNARMSVIMEAPARAGEAGRKVSLDTSPYEEHLSVPSSLFCSRSEEVWLSPWSFSSCPNPTTW